MLDFSDRTRTGISILTSAADAGNELIGHKFEIEAMNTICTAPKVTRGLCIVTSAHANLWVKER